jgi:hypothetical protein
MASGNQGWTDDKEFNWDDVGDAPPPPPADDIYRATIIKAEGEPTAKGIPSVALQLQLTSTHAGAAVKGKIYDKLVMDPESGALFRVKQASKAAGVALPKRNNLEAVSEFANELVGHEVWIKTRQEEFPKGSGKKNARVDMYVSDDKLAEVLGGGGGGEGAAPEAPRRRRAAQ